jgi:hypothetical protein
MLGRKIACCDILKVRRWEGGVKYFLGVHVGYAMLNVLRPSHKLVNQ